MSHILDVDNLQVSFTTYGGEVQAVRGVSFHVNAGETLAIVGESGSGKSVTAQAIMGMVSTKNGQVKEGEIVFKGEELTTLPKKKIQALRGSEIGMIFQDPMTSLNPTMKIGKQIEEGLFKHQKISKNEAKKKTIDLLKLVGIPAPERRYRQYPHECSGGMRQRIVIAIALACDPSLIIADEPTTALDVTIQAQILDVLTAIQQERNMSIVLITHDLGVVAEVADRVAVMYAGVVVESGSVDEIFENPQHPYTIKLLQSVPSSELAESQRLVPIEGTPPDLFSPPQGCPFAERCPFAMEVCVEYMPEEQLFSENHYAKCWLHDSRAAGVKEQFAGKEEVLW